MGKGVPQQWGDRTRQDDGASCQEIYYMLSYFNGGFIEGQDWSQQPPKESYKHTYIQTYSVYRGRSLHDFCARCLNERLFMHEHSMPRVFHCLLFERVPHKRSPRYATPRLLGFCAIGRHDQEPSAGRPAAGAPHPPRRLCACGRIHVRAAPLVNFWIQAQLEVKVCGKINISDRLIKSLTQQHISSSKINGPTTRPPSPPPAVIVKEKKRLGTGA
ncbi:hypothetical protein EVAR_78552_1 [Eumeta japonica]|uniref:Uncharacterized protein n=1 Tax=Eumeta variegata TaxID=151549 RepID=A0A4C1W705_EUMVA|nr:hypothetical protein EVAR_78552_1 [Eumeta japonica]